MISISLVGEGSNAKEKGYLMSKAMETGSGVMTGSSMALGRLGRFSGDDEGSFGFAGEVTFSSEAMAERS